ncbi:MAG: hypothetical protein ACYC1Q_07670 [Bacteroidia bacterium]
MIQDVNFGAFGMDGTCFEPNKGPFFKDLKIWMHPDDMVGDSRVLTWPSRGEFVHTFSKVNPGPYFRPKAANQQNELVNPGANNHYVFDNEFEAYKFMHDGSVFTAYFVSRLDPPGTGTNWIMGNANNFTSQIGFEHWEFAPSSTTLRIRFNRLNASGTRLTDLDAIISTNPFNTKVLCFSNDGSATRAYFKNNLIITRNDVGVPNSIASNGIIAIANVSGFGSFYTGTIYEIMLFTSLHNTQERQEVFDYLNNKYRTL